jgi:hypothetical protein
VRKGRVSNGWGHGGDAESNGGGRGSRSDVEDAGVYARWGRERKANAGFGRQIHGELEKKVRLLSPLHTF